MRKNLQSTFHSRQNMVSRDFELYYYEDQNLTKIDPHTHNYYEFYFFVEGDISMQVEKDIYPIHFGDIMLIPPDLAHRAIIHDSEISYRRFVFWISKEFFENLSQLSPYYTYAVNYAMENRKYLYHLDQISVNSLQAKMLRLLEEMRSSRFGKELQVSLYVEDLILSINRLVYDILEPKRYSSDAALYANLAEYIEEHLEDELSLEKLSEEFCISKYHIAHVFKDNIGLSIHQYITKKRLALCQEAIRTNTSITDVYHTYGFGDYSSFYRAFKKEYGISPKEYRDMQMKIVPENRETRSISN